MCMKVQIWSWHTNLHTASLLSSNECYRKTFAHMQVLRWQTKHSTELCFIMKLLKIISSKGILRRHEFTWTEGMEINQSNRTLLAGKLSKECDWFSRPGKDEQLNWKLEKLIRNSISIPNLPKSEKEQTWSHWSWDIKSKFKNGGLVVKKQTDPLSF